MTTRAYDILLTVNTASNFMTDQLILGRNSNSIGTIVNIKDTTLKVKLDNAYKSFLVGEAISSYYVNTYSVNTISNVSSYISNTNLVYPIPINNALSDSVIVYINNEPVSKYLYSIQDNTVIFNSNTSLVSANGELELNALTDRLDIQVVSNNTNATSFIAANVTSVTVQANAIILTANYSPYIADKNSVQPTGDIRLFTIYYPGEWYPPNSNGNPSNSGAGYPWPTPFPLRFAEFSGDVLSDSNAYVIYNNVKYKAIASDSGDILTDSSGSIGGLSLEVSNFEFDLAKLVNNKNLAGINTSNSTTAYVNGELVTILTLELW